MNEQPYQQLTPERVLDAAVAMGFMPTGRFLALNSYENRVYLVDVEDGEGLVLKFYRPGRWSEDQIREEHEFAAELAGSDLQVVAPLEIAGETLHFDGRYAYAGYPRAGGRWPELETAADRRQMGRFLGRMHAVGAAREFQYRDTLDLVGEMEDAVAFILEGDWVPPDLTDAYDAVAGQIIETVADVESAFGGVRWQRIHGDLHAGNILWREGPSVVDLDDCVTGPSVQDIWMLLPSEAEDRELVLGELIEGYEVFFSFDLRELGLIEALRARRIMSYAAWLGRRWDDPAFPRAFPWFEEARYWEQHILMLKEQFAVLQEGA